MIALGAYLLASVVAATPAATHGERLVSSYDQAACDPGDWDECAPPDPSIALAAPPAVLDCNDARLELYMAEMIGSCDMPAPTPPDRTTASVHPADPGPRRVCDATCNAQRACPVRPEPRHVEELLPLWGSSTAWLFAPPEISRLYGEEPSRLHSVPPSRLERPPRF